MANYNSQLQSNNVDLQTVLQTLQNKAAGGGGEQATPVISINTSGLITATAGTKSSTHQLAFQSAKTITPSATSQIAVSSGYYTGGNITVDAVPTQSKSVTPTSSTQNVTPDSGKFLSKVTVNAIPSTYVKPSYTKAATTYTPTTTNQTISAGTYLTGVQTIKGDSNLVSENIKSGVSIFGVSGTLVEGSGGGSGEHADWSENEDALISGTISGVYINDRVTKIAASVFAYRQLTIASFPAVTSIGANAFAYCTKLTTANFPVATYIDSSAFTYCTSLTTVSFPAATSIIYSAFKSCTSLTIASFPAVTSIGVNAFAYCTKLTTANFPVATYIGASAFMSCTSLTTVSFPAARNINNNAFEKCTKLITASFPAVTSIDSSAFMSCTSLTTVSFPSAKNIGYYAFISCYNLKSLYLTGFSVCTLSNSAAFHSTPIGGYSTSAGIYGTIYVPASLLTSYQTATNWTYFSSRFSAVEDCPDWDGTYGDN